MMATGYVHPVADGEVTTLREFALRCARGMGGLIMMRDDPMDAPIPDRFEPNTEYHDKALEAARKSMEDVQALSDAEAEDRAASEFEAALKQHVEYVSKAEEEIRRCRSMLASVEQWKTGAEGLKEFMVEQLKTSIGTGKTYAGDPPVRKTAADWRADKLDKASRDLSYHAIERNKEIDRTEARNLWLKALKDSLPES